MSSLVELKIATPDNAPMLAAEAALHEAESMTISSPSQLMAATETLKGIKRKWKEIEATRKSLVAPLDEGRERIQAFFRPPLDFLASAEGIYKSKITAYQSEERRIALEIARKETERLRKLDEAKAKRAEASGNTGRAEELRERAIIVPVVPTTKLAGTSTRELWSAELLDIKALCAAIADGKAPADMVTFNQSAGNRLASALKDAADVPGVRFMRTESMAVRA